MSGAGSSRKRKGHPESDNWPKIPVSQPQQSTPKKATVKLFKKNNTYYPVPTQDLFPERDNGLPQESPNVSMLSQKDSGEFGVNCRLVS